MKRTALFALLLLGLAGGLWAQDEPPDVTQVARRLVVEEGQHVGDAICVGCSIEIHGTVDRDAVAIAGSITVFSNGEVQRDTLAIGGGIQLRERAYVSRDALAIGGHLKKDPAAFVGHDAHEQSFIPGLVLYGLAGLIVVTIVPWSVLNIILALIAAGVMGHKRVETVVETLQVQPLMAVMAGMSAVVAAVILWFIASLIGDTVGVVVASIVAIALGVATVVGYTGVSAWVGHGLGIQRTLAAMVVGAVVITLLQLVPLFGLAMFAIYVLFAIGSAVVSGFGTAPDWLGSGAAPPRAATRPAA